MHSIESIQQRRRAAEQRSTDEANHTTMTTTTSRTNLDEGNSNANIVSSIDVSHPQSISSSYMSSSSSSVGSPSVSPHHAGPKSPSPTSPAAPHADTADETNTNNTTPANHDAAHSPIPNSNNFDESLLGPEEIDEARRQAALHPQQQQQHQHSQPRFTEIEYDSNLSPISISTFSSTTSPSPSPPPKLPKESTSTRLKNFFKRGKKSPHHTSAAAGGGSAPTQSSNSLTGMLRTNGTQHTSASEKKKKKTTTSSNKQNNAQQQQQQQQRYVDPHKSRTELDSDSSDSVPSTSTGGGKRSVYTQKLIHLSNSLLNMFTSGASSSNPASLMSFTHQSHTFTNSPAWILGRVYKLLGTPPSSQHHSSSSHSSAYDVAGASMSIHAAQMSTLQLRRARFLSDFSSQIWCTYRRGFPSIASSVYSSDAGWGCFPSDTAITLNDGFSRPIIDVAVGTHVLSIDKVSTAGRTEVGFVAKPTSALLDQGVKECVELLFSDGRTITCTPDHRFLTADGKWITAEDMTVGITDITAGMEYPHLAPLVDADAAWELDLTDSLGFKLNARDGLSRSLAFAGLLGYLLTDGRISEDGSALYPGHPLDVQALVRDIHLLTGIAPTDSRDGTVWAIHFPAQLHQAMLAVGASTADRIETLFHFPAFLMSPTCPVSVVQAFIGGLFGGGGEAPSLTWEGNQAQFAEIRFSLTRKGSVQADQTRATTEELQCLMMRCGIPKEALVESLSSSATPGVDPNASYSIEWSISASATLSFARSVGFRYCCHKQLRLTVACAYYRHKETLSRQKKFISDATLAEEAACGGRPFVGGESEHSQLMTCIKEAKAQLAKQENVHPDIMAWKPTGLKDANQLGMDVHDALQSFDALKFFMPAVTDATVYGVDSEVVLPSFRVRLLSKRAAGSKATFDLSVPETENFIANGLTVHNCMIRSAQMMLAQVYVRHYLGRDWRRPDKIKSQQTSTTTSAATSPPSSNHPHLHDDDDDDADMDRSIDTLPPLPSAYLRILSLFLDSPSTSSPYSIHNLLHHGQASKDKKVGEWFGPHAACGMIRRCMEGELEKLQARIATTGTNATPPVAFDTDAFGSHDYTGGGPAGVQAQSAPPPTSVPPAYGVPKIYVSDDGTLYLDKIMSLARTDDSRPSASDDDAKSDVESPSYSKPRSSSTSSLATMTSSTPHPPHFSSTFHPLMILIPLRLGIDKLNTSYVPSLLSLFQFPQCIGIIGGKPRASFYFIGVQDDLLFYLDPHTVQKAADLTGPHSLKNGNLAMRHEIADSYHSANVLSIRVQDIDPSLAIGFYIENQDAMDEFWEQAKRLTDASQLQQQQQPSLTSPFSPSPSPPPNVLYPVFHVADVSPNYAGFDSDSEDDDDDDGGEELSDTASEADFDTRTSDVEGACDLHEDSPVAVHTSSLPTDAFGRPLTMDTLTASPVLCAQPQPSQPIDSAPLDSDESGETSATHPHGGGHTAASLASASVASITDYTYALSAAAATRITSSAKTLSEYAASAASQSIEYATHLQQASIAAAQRKMSRDPPPPPPAQESMPGAMTSPVRAPPAAAPAAAAAAAAAAPPSAPSARPSPVCLTTSKTRPTAKSAAGRSANTHRHGHQTTQPRRGSKGANRQEETDDFVFL